MQNVKVLEYECALFSTVAFMQLDWNRVNLDNVFQTLSNIQELWINFLFVLC